MIILSRGTSWCDLPHPNTPGAWHDKTGSNWSRGLPESCVTIRIGGIDHPHELRHHRYGVIGVAELSVCMANGQAMLTLRGDSPGRCERLSSLFSQTILDRGNSLSAQVSHHQQAGPRSLRLVQVARIVSLHGMIGTSFGNAGVVSGCFGEAAPNAENQVVAIFCRITGPGPAKVFRRAKRKEMVSSETRSLPSMVVHDRRLQKLPSAPVPRSLRRRARPGLRNIGLAAAISNLAAASTSCSEGADALGRNGR